MYAAEQLFDTLTYDEIYYTLRTLSHEDCYIFEFFQDKILQDFVYLLELYDIVFVATDKRILLTQKGNVLFQYLNQIVEINKY